jgi:hypothetical protein
MPIELSSIESQPAGTEVVVSGFVLGGDGGSAVLAEMLAESFPPQAGGVTVPLDDFDIEQLPGVTTAESVRWTEQPVTLQAVVVEGHLTEAVLVEE